MEAAVRQAYAVILQRAHQIEDTYTSPGTDHGPLRAASVGPAASSLEPLQHSYPGVSKHWLCLGLLVAL